MLQHGNREPGVKSSPKKSELLLSAVKGVFNAQVMGSSRKETQLTIAYSTDRF